MGQQRAVELAPAALEQARDLVVSRTEETNSPASRLRTGKNEGPSVTYHLNARLTVPSRNDEQVIEVARLRDESGILLQGRAGAVAARLSPGQPGQQERRTCCCPARRPCTTASDFVGRMNLPLVAIGEEFTVGFGAEPQLQVHRQMMDKNRTMQGGNQVLKYEYRILVSSYKQDKVKLQLWDRLPQAENETMTITLVKTHPEISKDPVYLREERPGNLLRWDLDVEPDTNGENAKAVKYEFRLEFDKQNDHRQFPEQVTEITPWAGFRHRLNLT